MDDCDRLHDEVETMRRQVENMKVDFACTEMRVETFRRARELRRQAVELREEAEGLLSRRAP